MFWYANIVFYLCQRNPRRLQSIPFGVVDLNQISISTFVDTRNFSARVCEGFAPLAFLFIPTRGLGMCRLRRSRILRG